MARRKPRGDALAKRKHIGRPTRLTTVTADAIVHTVLDGNHITTACAAANVGQSTLYRWLERADEVQQAIDDGEPYDPDDLRYVEFRDRLADARACAEMRAVQVIERSMHGGYVIEEEPVLDLDGQPVRNDDGEILWKRKYAQPDGRLALQYLARSRPDSWGQNPTNRIELTGADGGPVQVAAADHIGQLSQQLALVAAQRREEDEEDGDVYDAELVD